MRKSALASSTRAGHYAAGRPWGTILALALLLGAGVFSASAQNAGHFTFSQSNYTATESENDRPWNHPVDNRDSTGALITVVRNNGTTGRMLVDVETVEIIGVNASAIMTNIGANNDILFQAPVEGTLYNGLQVVLVPDTEVTSVTVVFDEALFTLEIHFVPDLHTAQDVVDAVNADGTIMAENFAPDDGTGVLTYDNSVDLMGGIYSILGGFDFEMVRQTLVFNDYQRSAQFEVGIFDNDEMTPSRFVPLQITGVRPDTASGENGSLAPTYSTNGATLEIVDNDTSSIGVIQFLRAYYRRTEYVGTALIELRRVGGDMTKSAKVDYSVNYGSAPNNFNTFPLTAEADYATPDSDYATIPSPYYGTVTFPAGYDWATIRVDITDDNLAEFNEDIIIELWNDTDSPNPRFDPDSAPKGYLLGDQSWAILTTLFDDQTSGGVDRGYNSDNQGWTTPRYLENPGANFTVNGLATQDGDAAVLVGDFQSYNGFPRSGIVRVLSDGMIDENFSASPGAGANGSVKAVAAYPTNSVQSGKVVVAGMFQAVDGILRNGVARLNADGTVDATFSPGTGVRGPVFALALQSDDKVVIGGDFTNVSGVVRTRLARFNSDGSVDTAFNPGLGPDFTVRALAVDAAGKILVGGEFLRVNNVIRPGIARLNADGTLDASFNPGSGIMDGAVRAIVIEDNGGILLGGAFTEVDARYRSGLARLNADGSLDLNYDPGIGFNETVYSLDLQPDGKLLVGGIFTSYNDTRRCGIARLYADASLDTTFMDTAYNQFAGLHVYRSTDPQPAVYAVGVLTNKIVLIGGAFDRVGGGYSRTDVRPRKNFAGLVGGETDGPGNLFFERKNFYFDEYGSGGVSVWRRNGNLGVVSVRVSTQDLPVGPGAAQAGLDYVASSPNLTWSSYWPSSARMKSTCLGNFNWTFNYTIINDRLIEGNETFLGVFGNLTGSLNLGGVTIPIGIALGARTANMTIVDDDFDRGVFTFSAPSYTVNEDGIVATVTVTRTNGAGGAASVDYFLQDGTATAGADYTRKTNNTRLDFSADETSRSINIPIINDYLSEPDETLYIGLRNPSLGASIDSSAADPSFDTGTGANGPVYAAVTFTNAAGEEKVVLGGGFTSFNGMACNRIVLLNTNGTIDTNIMSGVTGANGAIYAMALDISNRLVIAGDFTAFNGIACGRMARLKPDGSVDTAFNVGVGANAAVRALGVSGNMIYAGGDFTAFRGDSALKKIVRVNDAGAPDASFGNPSMDGSVQALAVQTDGFVLLGGTFTTVGGYARSGIARLDLDGGVDMNFDPGTGANSAVRALALQADGAILVGGSFTLFNGVERNRLVRLVAATGALDASFDPGRGVEGPSGLGIYYVSAIKVHNQGTDTGKIVVGGEFTRFNLGGHQRLARLFSDGALDPGFNPQCDGPVHALAIQRDNKIVVGGSFSQVNNQGQNAVTRISPAIAQLAIIDDDFTSGRVSFTTYGFRTNENSGQARISVQRTGGTSGSLTVRVRAANGTATNGAHYLSVTNTLTWTDADPEAVKLFTVPLLNNELVDGDKTVNLYLDNPSITGALGVQSNAILTIVDDDSYGALAFSQPTYAADENGTSLSIPIVRTGGVAGTVSVQVAATNGSGGIGAAVNGVDFVGFTNVITLGPGLTETNVTLTLLDNSRKDGDRMLNLRLLNATNAVFGIPRTAQLTIIDDESFNIPAGSTDTAFNTAEGANGQVYVVGLQTVASQQRTLIAGDFTTVNGMTRNRICRLNADSTVDAAFLPSGSGPNAPIRAMQVQTDGRILVGGMFTNIHSVNRPGLARLNLDGTIDTTFNPGAGADNTVFAVVEMFDGTTRKVLVGGAFTTFNGFDRSGVVRLLDTGAVDSSFNVGAGANGVVYAIAVQADGKVLLGGEFTAINGVPCNKLARLNTDGSVDVSFDATIGADASIRAIVVQPDGRILVGGSFGSIQGVAWRSIARLKYDGTPDTTFDPGVGADGPVFAIAVQKDGKVLLGGEFRHYNSVTRNRLTRLNQDGTVDPAINFGTGANNFINSLAIQEDRRIVFGGGFTEYNGAARNFYARIHGGSLYGAGQIEFVAATQTVVETQGSASISLRRTGGTAGLVTARVVIQGGTATQGLDYQMVTNIIAFAEGENYTNIVIPLLDDREAEPDETVLLDLTDFTGGATNGSQPTTTLIIQSDDCVVDFLYASLSVSESVSGSNAVVTVVRNGTTNDIVTVDYVTLTNGTATAASNGVIVAGTDYIAVRGTLVFQPGETNLTFFVPIVDDLEVEPNESIPMVLTNVVGAAVLGRSNATLQIIDNDNTPGTLAFATNAYSVAETGTNITIQVVRRGGNSGVVSVDYYTTNGTARSGFDYLQRAGTLAFADQEVVKTITIQVVDDQKAEGNEFFHVVLHNPNGGALLDVISAIPVTIEDNEFGSGSVDPAFDPGVGPNNLVRSLAAQKDGSLLVGGAFNLFAGTNRNGIARVGTNGTIDLSFNPGAGANGMVTVIKVGADGPITLGGLFSSFNSNSFNRVVRLQTNGMVEPNFSKPNTLNAAVNAMVLEPEGKVILGGGFSSPIPGVLRMNNDGSVDTSFNPGAGVNGQVYALAQQTTDGKILVGGNFTTMNGVTRLRLARLHYTGLLDESFQAPDITNGVIQAVVIQPDGRILIAGEFTHVGDVARPRIARLLQDGSLDTSFDPGFGCNDTVFCLGLQADEKILVGGSFTNVQGVARNRIARLNKDGSLDTAFDPGTGANNVVYTLVILPDGKIAIGGDFTMVNGYVRRGVARLNADVTGGIRFVSSQVGGGLFRWTVSSQPGRSYVLEATTDLRTWFGVMTNQASMDKTLGFELELTDPMGLTTARRFYRVRQVGP